MTGGGDARAARADAPGPRVLRLASSADSRGLLVPFDTGLPFTPVRTFVVVGAPGAVRGGHARAGWQLLVAVAGTVTVELAPDGGPGDAGVGSGAGDPVAGGGGGAGGGAGPVVLDAPDTALLLPPGTWARQRYGPGAVLLVLSSLPFAEEEPVLAGTTAAGARVVLRPVRPGEEGPDEESPWEDWGEDPLPVADTVGEVGRLLVELDGVLAGSVSWHRVYYGPTASSRAWNTGIALAPWARGRGAGALAQRMLAEHLLATTDAERVEASTDVDNVVEQRSLERAGFTREGVLRSAQGRRDGRHDLAVYSLLGADLEAPAPQG